MLIKDFAEYLQKLEDNASRNAKTEILSELFKALKKDEIKNTVYLLNGRVAPTYIPIEFNFSSKLLIRSLSLIQPDEDIAAKFKEMGDIGLVSQTVIGNSKEDYEINELYNDLLNFSQVSGKGSQEQKIIKAKEILIKAGSLGAKYISRILVGNLRTGFSEKTILDAMSHAISGNKELRKQLDRAFGVRSDLGEIAELAFEDKDSILDLDVEVGTPLKAKLVEREKSVEALFERLGDCYIQPKYDGLRAQVHFHKGGIKSVSVFSQNNSELSMFSNDNKGEVMIFSRNMEQLTDMFPDVIERVSKMNVDSIVFDSEVIGFDAVNNVFVPFQETIQRKRKYGVAEKASGTPVKVFIFDIIELNGKDLTTLPLHDRYEIMKEQINFGENDMLQLTETTLINSEDALMNLFDRYTGMGLEGIIAKGKDTIYKPGTRDFDWIKLKASISKDMVDTVDGVLMGYYKGEGVRAKFGIGALLMGVYDPKTESYSSIAKIGTGIKDNDWPIMKEKLDSFKVEEKPDNYFVEKILYPDVWVMPKIVCEVESDEITKSKNHYAGRDKDGWGYSLRFPRLKIFNRDKKPTDSTSIDEVKRMYELSK